MKSNSKTHNKTPFYSITNSAVTVILNGKPRSISSKYSTQYKQAIEAIKSKNWDSLYSIFNIIDSLAQYANKLVYLNNSFLFNGKVLNNIVTKKIKDFWLAGLPAEPLFNFLNNCLLNPRQESVEELYLFLEKNGFTLTEDGCFIAWRKVDDNYMSYNENPDGTHNRNYPGDVVKMDRNLCDFNRKNTCSRGLHFCAWDYLSYYHGGSGKTMLVKINPRNVVSIPNDYNDAKGRCCEYEVLEEVLTHEKVNILENKGYFQATTEGVKYYNNRDKNGRFKKLN